MPEQVHETTPTQKVSVQMPTIAFGGDVQKLMRMPDLLAECGLKEVLEAWGLAQDRFVLPYL
tara:strand:- start:182 stop:367 length:186 start_codon:yes stop_codon:yes gene_type:complete